MFIEEVIVFLEYPVEPCEKQLRKADYRINV